MKGFFVLYTVYIIYSYSLKKFYTGLTANLDQRMEFHNNGMNHFTKKGVPWKVIATFGFTDKVRAMSLEKQIKQNGAKRYLERNNITFSI